MSKEDNRWLKRKGLNVDENNEVATLFNKLVPWKFGEMPQLFGIFSEQRNLKNFYDAVFSGAHPNREVAWEYQGDRDMFFQAARSINKKPIALDFMGTLNDPKSKGMIWGAVQEAILRGDTEALEASGMTKDQVAYFKQHIIDTGCKPMEFRDYALAQEGVKKVLGAYFSIGAEAGQLDFCKAYDDAVDFLTVSKALGHPVEIFSTIGAPKGYRGLSEIMLGNHELSSDYQLFLRCFGEECKTAGDLITDYVASKKKKVEPGQSVLEETAKKGLHLYVDDESGIIDATVNSFGAQQETQLPVLCRIEREGVKQPGYQPPSDHPGIENIVVANSLMGENLLKAIYLP